MSNVDHKATGPKYEREHRSRTRPMPKAPTVESADQAEGAPLEQPAALTSWSRRQLRKVRAWMLVLPVDAALLLLPILCTPSQWKATVAVTILSLALMTDGGRYRARLYISILDELPSVLAKLFTAAAMVATIIALRHLQEDVTTFLTNAVASIGLVVVGRAITAHTIVWSRRRRYTRHNAVLVGGGPLATELYEILRGDPRYGLNIVGCVDENHAEGCRSIAPSLGRMSELDAVVTSTDADVLLIADGEFSERQLLDVARTPACLPCDLLVVPRLHHFHTQTRMSDHIGSVPIMRIKTPSLHGPPRILKRVFDIIVASVALLLALPMFVILGLAVRIEGGPGIIFKQPRVGRDGVIFHCYKLRSMRPLNEKESATKWTIDGNSDRIGPVGRFIRRTSFDELPQLWNILRGDMSIVGPRPERPHFVSRFSQEFDRYSHRHRVRAGLTGLAQVSGLRGDTSIADRARFDNYYIENWSLWLDIKIIIRTFTEVILGRGR